ncbi:MAG: universal stress protein [Ardenticatenaceae bacterium]|nr:universal stress protein [Ardenticatenaceae bacterium]HBY97896.1 universal stress protein UspA [Chloroflexota bacterium]
MSEAEREPAIQRILVALDVSSYSLAALDAAAELAAGLRAELLGLFVEDINLVRVADLPFSREMGLFSATVRQFDRREVERQFQVQAERARQALMLIAGQAQVRWAFRVTRGPVASEVLAAASEADLIALGKVGWSLAGPARLGSTAHAVVSETPRPALILQGRVRPGAPMLVVYDGSPGAHAALAVATHLARRANRQLTVLIVADGSASASRLQAHADAWLWARGLRARSHRLIRADTPTLAAAVRAEGSCVLVLPGESPLRQGQALARLLSEVECSVLLVD